MNSVEKTGYLQKHGIWHLSYIMYKNQLKWINNLNVRSEIVKLLEENLEETFYDIGLCSDFLDRMQKCRQQKPSAEFIFLQHLTLFWVNVCIYMCKNLPTALYMSINGVFSI
jgi:hypothetical protein